MLEIPSPIVILESTLRRVTFTIVLSLDWSPLYPHLVLNHGGWFAIFTKKKKLNFK